ncbi:aldehyde dehydrogenase family protein [Aeromicrobium yanjiei]|uniref:Aldehyde dehydrogenase family protein n=1 Tax=Aeromicrobium yanjiei TaxID=2662028 RepID=A0A5Q2MFY7_9ACTN|nr:aldehyde dehydrogenase family protein [Aeromicrobium yanjiei]QGG40591.1 aldehyde dehydrogenase family protein [Aeromicrobium yanjiei]
MTNSAVSVNPATGEQVAQYPFVTPDELGDVLGSAAAGQQRWAARSLADRCDVMRTAAEIMRDDVERLAELITTEMGKPITEARGEVLKCAHTLDWYAEQAPETLAPVPTAAGPGVQVHYRPLGVVLAVMPWNFPIWQAMRGSVGILLGGNGYLLKPSPTTVGCAVALQEVYERAGVEHGAFGVLNAANGVVSAALADDVIVGVTLTGSVAAGSAVAAQAAREIKPSVLELGGSDPFIVLADADLDAAVDAAVTARFQNSGQVCIAAKRIILEEPILEEFTEKFVEQVKALVVGDPSDAATRIGPMARSDLRDQLADQVDRSLEAGATLLVGGEKLPGSGYFYAPTVLSDVVAGSPGFCEELFGPVAVLVAATDAEHAITLANDSEFGLGSSVWTTDLDRAEKVAAQIQAGSVFINKVGVSDPRVPIGGIKKSGYGRELSHHALREFTNQQTVWCERAE